MLSSLLNLVVSILVILIIARAILSWVPELTWRYREITRVVETVTEPVLEPFRRLVPPRKTGGIDLSPALAIIALSIARQLLDRLLAGGIIWR